MTKLTEVEIDAHWAQLHVSPIDENFLSVAVIKDGDRHTPDSLAGDAPVLSL